MGDLRSMSATYIATLAVRDQTVLMVSSLLHANAHDGVPAEARER
jgi:hypothetical protein